ncbi:biosynthetic-type acetolactate synthase large subunit [bacterium]|nr:biosynthetic-type acetolactate synthase large subunit [bacterium]
MKTAVLRRYFGKKESFNDKQEPVSQAGQVLGADILFKTLIDCDVDTLFGYPGGKVLSLYDRLLEYPQLKHVLVSHEQGAAHAADGYARVTGKPGVVLTTSGPGATNTVTGIANAFMDSVPIIVFTGQVERPLLGKMAFQESNIIDITKSITKWNFQVQTVNLLEGAVRQAFKIAVEGRPGPVLIDLPKDIFMDFTVYQKKEITFQDALSSMRFQTAQSLYKAAEYINHAKKPLIYAGGGVISGEASEALRQFAIKNRIPVTTTLMGLGAFAEDHELSLGMLGMHGTWTANMAVQNCDVLIALGARFDDRVTSRIDGFSPHSIKIHVDIDEKVIGQNVKTDVAIVDQLKPVLYRLNELVSKPQEETAWLKEIGEWKKNHPLSYAKASGVLKPQAIIERISAITPENSIMVTDVGQHQMWAAQFFKYTRPRSFVTSGGLGTMGFGLPAAIGAQMGSPDSTVICLCGDGGFRMTSTELSTAVSQQLPLKIFVFNNSSLGMVKQWQNFYFEKRYAHSILHDSNPDFLKLAESYGAMSLRLVKENELEFVLNRAFSINNRPVLVECIIDSGENVFPMVNPGACLDEMVEWSD